MILAIESKALYLGALSEGAVNGAPPLARRGLGRMAAVSADSRVLVVDDERLIADSLAQILRARGYAVRVAYGGAEAMAAAEEECPDIVLTDVLMPQINGVQAAIAIRHRCPGARIILFSGQTVTRDLLEEARAAGHHFELWAKPLHPRDLLKKLEN